MPGIEVQAEKSPRRAGAVVMRTGCGAVFSGLYVAEIAVAQFQVAAAVVHRTAEGARPAAAASRKQFERARYTLCVHGAAVIVHIILETGRAGATLAGGKCIIAFGSTVNIDLDIAVIIAAAFFPVQAVAVIGQGFTHSLYRNGVAGEGKAEIAAVAGRDFFFVAGCRRKNEQGQQ